MKPQQPPKPAFLPLLNTNFPQQMRLPRSGETHLQAVIIAVATVRDYTPHARCLVLFDHIQKSVHPILVPNIDTHLMLPSQLARRIHPAERADAVKPNVVDR